MKPCLKVILKKCEQSKDCKRAKAGCQKDVGKGTKHFESYAGSPKSHQRSWFAKSLEDIPTPSAMTRKTSVMPVRSSDDTKKVQKLPKRQESRCERLFHGCTLLVWPTSEGSVIFSEDGCFLCRKHRVLRQRIFILASALSLKRGIPSSSDQRLSVCTGICLSSCAKARRSSRKNRKC